MVILVNSCVSTPFCMRFEVLPFFLVKISARLVEIRSIGGTRLMECPG